MFRLDMGVASVMSALPIMIPLVFLLVRRLGRRTEG
jgi:hypothetical protein